MYICNSFKGRDRDEKVVEKTIEHVAEKTYMFLSFT